MKRRQVGWTTIVIVSVIAGSCYFYRVWTTWQIRKHLAQLEKAGEPIKFNQMDAHYPEVKPEQNAALIYVKAFEKIEAADREQVTELLADVRWLNPAAALSKSNKLAIAGIVARCSSALELLHNANRLANARYPVKLSEWPKISLDHLDGVAAAGRLLALDVIVHVDEGQFASAVKSLQSLLSLGASLRREPLMDSHRFRWFCYATAFDLIPRVLVKADLEQKHLMVIEKALEHAAEPVHMTAALSHLRCARLTVDDAAYLKRKIFRRNAIASLSAEIGLPLLRLTGRFEGDQLFYLQHAAEFIEASTRPFADRLALIDKKRSDDRYKAAKYRLFWVSALLFADQEAYILGDIENSARLEVALAVIAAERFRQRTGVPPASLRQLVPEYIPSVPLDPFDDQPLRFRNRGTNYLVYSIGRDRGDNAGLMLKDGEPITWAHDIVLQIPVSKN